MNNVNISPYAAPGIRREPKAPAFEKTEENIIALVCEKTGISWENISGPRGSIKVSTARFIMCYFLFYYIIANKTEVGKIINIHHTTVINALKKFPDFYKTDDNFRETVDKITLVIKS